jgi:hypothetical protein
MAVGAIVVEHLAEAMDGRELLDARHIANCGASGRGSSICSLHWVMVFPAPRAPTFPSRQAAVTTGFLRYEDVMQDGRLLPLAIPPALGALWRDSLTHHLGHMNAIKTGVMPILTRLTIESIDQQIRVDRAIESRSGFEVAAAPDGSRLYLNVWSEIFGAAGKIGRSEPGPLALAGKVFAEHTFTRPFAPPDQRRVTKLSVDGYPEVPDAVYAAPAATSAQEPPDGAHWLDELDADSAESCFTLDNTDSNQHVNSLTYIRLFIDAAQRRLALATQPAKIRSRAVDIAYRKPCFVGDRVRAFVRLFEHAGQLGAAGYVAADDGKPRCYVRVMFGA